MNKHVLESVIEGEPGKKSTPPGDSRTGHPRPETRPKPPPAGEEIARGDQQTQSRDPQSPSLPADKPQPAEPQPDPAAAAEASTRRRLARAGLIIAAVVVMAVVWWPWGGRSGAKITYEIVPAAFGTIVESAHATGVLAPSETADIVSPLPGRVQSVEVETGERVMKGQLLARVLSDSAREELMRALTALASDQAAVARAEADITEERAALARARMSSTPGAVDSAQARFARALADAEEARAVLRQTQDRVAQARAQIASLDLRAPFNGIVLKTGIASGEDTRANTREEPLFTIAADLSQLKLQADFPESALGRLHAGNRAEFTTPAYPRRVFPAVLTGLDLLPKKESKEGKEVTYYAGALSVANRDGALRPGMDTNIGVIVAEARNVLVVPNTALNFMPVGTAESAQSGNPPLTSSAASARARRIWVIAGGRLQARDVTLGLSDGRFTQVVAGPLRAGEHVVTGAIVKTNGSQT